MWSITTNKPKNSCINIHRCSYRYSCSLGMQKALGGKLHGSGCAGLLWGRQWGMGFSLTATKILWSFIDRLDTVLCVLCWVLISQMSKACRLLSDQLQFQGMNHSPHYLPIPKGRIILGMVVWLQLSHTDFRGVYWNSLIYEQVKTVMFNFLLGCGRSVTH